MKQTTQDLVTTGTPQHHGIPCTMFYSLFRALLGDRAFLPPSLCGSSPAKLDASVGASGPHDFAVREPLPLVCGAASVHRIPPHVRDDAYVPRVEAGWRGRNHDF